MAQNRRLFLKSSLAAGAALPFAPTVHIHPSADPVYEKLDAALGQPVFKKELFPDPVVIESVELLRYQDNFLCRVRSEDGAEGLCVSHNFRMVYLHPIHVLQVQPFFAGKDARELDQLIEDVYLYNNNYKLQNMALWIPIATVELALLDMMGRIAGKSMGELIGDVRTREMAVYRANNHRGKSAEESIELIKETAEETGAKAVKFKIGGRMGNEEVPTGRTEKMIPLMRETFGPDMTIYADANGSYDAEEAVRIGRLLEANGIDLFEGPVPFDWYEDIKAVADVVTIPLAGGGQEASMRNFRWLIGNNAFQVLQQDVFYFGGMIRCMKVARMADAVSLTCTPHVSGTGLGYLYLMQFISAIPNAGPYHEFKGLSEGIPFECATSALTPKDGLITIPTGPGSGVEIDPEFVAKHEPVQM